MSRIGKEPVALPAGVTAKVDGQKVTVKGKLGELAYVMHDGITAKVEDGKVVVERKDDTIKNFHGLARALIHNNVVGVSEGYKKQLVIEGTGFKAALQGKQLALSLGFASPKIFDIPDGLTVTVENDGLQVTLTGIDKEVVGESAARIRSFYPAEPYKGKGIKYLGEMSFNRKDQRAKRHLRLRQRVIGSVERPRMSICVTNKHMYVQFIDDAAGNTLAQASSLKESKANLEVAKKLGAAAAEAAKAKGITRVVVDRGGFKFTGRVAAIVASAVENGLSISDKPAKEAE